MEPYTTRILGYDIKFKKPQQCVNCNKKSDLQILGRIIDTDNETIRYILVLKCPMCHNVVFAIYNIGKENELPLIEKQSKDNPIEPSLISGSLHNID